MQNDAVIIGGGPAGYTAAIRIAQLGGRAVLVEKEWVGGVCTNLGCIPTKSMQASVRLLEEVKRSVGHPVELIDYGEIVRRRKRAVDISAKGIERLLSSYGISVMLGEAAIASGTSVEVVAGDLGRDHIEARNIVIATGSVPQGLERIRRDGKRVLYSDDVLALDGPPESMAIIGGGAMGVEFATIFNALGTEITILEKMDRILPSEDWEISDSLRKIMNRRGIRISTNCDVIGLDDDGLEIRVADRSDKIRAEKILVAVGRRPRFRPEELTRLGIAFTARGIAVDRRMETNVKGIYAIGDVTGPPFLAHAAKAEGLVCAENVMGREAKVDLSKVPNCIYTIPEAAGIGVRTDSAEGERGFKVGKSNFASNGEARARGETEGFVKVLVEKEGDALAGAHVLGPGATEIVAAASLAMAFGATADRIGGCIIAHPTLAEAFIEAVRDAAGEALDKVRG